MSVGNRWCRNGQFCKAVGKVADHTLVMEKLTLDLTFVAWKWLCPPHFSHGFQVQTILNQVEMSPSGRRFGGKSAFLTRGTSLTWVLEVRQNILCVFVTLPLQGQMSFHRLHSSSMHISVWKMNRDKNRFSWNVNVWHKRMKTHTTSHGSTTNSNSRIMWKPLIYCRCVSMPTWASAYNTHIHTHTIQRWGHRLIHSRRNEWKWSGERDSIISLWWCSSPQRDWNENTALCPQHQTARSTMYQEKPIRYTIPSKASSQ